MASNSLAWLPGVARRLPDCLDLWLGEHRRSKVGRTTARAPTSSSGGFQFLTKSTYAALGVK